MTHTRGPWAAYKPEHQWQIRGQDDGSGPEAARFGVLVAECYANAQEADAKLMAAAPDLLEALQEAVNKGYMWDHDPELWSKANAAIAKAKGN